MGAAESGDEIPWWCAAFAFAPQQMKRHFRPQITSEYDKAPQRQNFDIILPYCDNGVIQRTNLGQNLLKVILKKFGIVRLK